MKMRMDRYRDNNEDDNETVLSRTIKNQDIYKDAYLNSSVVDIDNILQEDKNEESSSIDIQEKPPIYEEKSYDVNEYIKKAHEKFMPDNAMRSLNDENFQNQEHEITKLIATIDEKENSEELFSDLMGDDENTMIEGQFTNTFTNEESTLSIYKEMKEETRLDKVLSDETIINLTSKSEQDLDKTFEKILANEKLENSKYKSKTPLIFFLITLSMLIIVIVIIIFK